MTLREVLHAHIPYLTPESSVRDAVDKMDIYQFPALVVVDDNLFPIAVLTEGDLARAINLRGSLVEIFHDSALTYATREPTTASPDTEIGDALHKMLMSGLTILPVVETNRLSGVVLRIDLMQALLLDTVPKS